MRLEELVNSNELKTYVSNVGPRVALINARDVAERLVGDTERKKAVHMMFNVCNALPDGELTCFRAQLGIEGMFDKLADVEKQRFCDEAFSNRRVA